ncbi:22397_t:CDS:2, partial [Dentiscutata erythropus]
TCPFKYFVYQYERNYNAKDQNRDCHIQEFFHLKNQMRIDNYKLANGDQKEKKSGIKEKLQISKIHFDLVASDKDSIIYFNNNKSEKNRYKDRILQDEQILQDARECIEDIIEENLSGDEAV